MSWVVEGRNSFLISQPLLQRRFVLLLERQQSATKMYENKTLQFDWLREQFLFWEKKAHLLAQWILFTVPPVTMGSLYTV